eukprot:4049999-Amphidinium_carterae.1
MIDHCFTSSSRWSPSHWSSRCPGLQCDQSQYVSMSRTATLVTWGIAGSDTCRSVITELLAHKSFRTAT